MDFTYPIITKSAQETAEVGWEFARHLKEGKLPRVVFLYGDLGSGKTTFTQGFAKGLGITSRLLSPTFIIVRRYDIPDHDGFFYHVDLYRLNSADETDELGLSEIFADPANFVVVEWAEKLEEAVPDKRSDIWFTTLDDGRHRIVIKNVL